MATSYSVHGKALAYPDPPTGSYSKGLAKAYLRGFSRVITADRRGIFLDPAVGNEAWARVVARNRYSVEGYISAYAAGLREGVRQRQLRLDW